MAEPKYFAHPNVSYRGNPYIEGLGMPLSSEQFYANCEIPFHYELDLSGVDESLHSYLSVLPLTNWRRFIHLQMRRTVYTTRCDG